MVVDPRKRQKKLEKQKAKKKAERKEITRRESQGMPVRLAAASEAPILHCCYLKAFWEVGIGNVLISRQLSSGNVAFVMFLVDVYCLGVKDLFLNILPRAVYDEKIYDHLLDQGPVQKLKPEYARKLVEGAVEYARALELPPHSDYRVGKLIFGDISAEACPEQFVFGKNGNPFFFAGPHDHAARCHEILLTLNRVCGPGGYLTRCQSTSHRIRCLDFSTPRIILAGPAARPARKAMGCNCLPM